MGTMFTPPIDLYDTEDDAREAVRAEEPRHDDRETGFVLETHPRENGDVDDAAVAAGGDRWQSVLGW